MELREASPLTFVAAMARRRGRQRGPGGLIPALVTLNKFRVSLHAPAASDFLTPFAHPRLFARRARDRGWGIDETRSRGLRRPR